MAAVSGVFQFATEQYKGCMNGLPNMDVDQLRKDAAKYIRNFDKNKWHADPVRTMINGKFLDGGKTQDTPDAFGNIVGKMVMGTPDQIQQVRLIFIFGKLNSLY